MTLTRGPSFRAHPQTPPFPRAAGSLERNEMSDEKITAVKRKCDGCGVYMWNPDGVFDLLCVDSDSLDAFM